jgi:single-stranded-DNA-specific exonuclease
MKKWQVENRLKKKSSEFKVEDLIKCLLENRSVTTKKEIDDFLNPKLLQITTKSLNLNKKQIDKSIVRIKKAIKNNEKIIIYGDYDVDGICGSAILWETLNFLKANVTPYIPSRFDEGYGLSKEGIDNLLQKEKIGLIITVDNGIVANSAVDYANKKGIDVIITDHHVESNKLPNSFSIVHTTSLCGAGVAYVFSKLILKQKISENDDHLSLVCLATIADLVPLFGANRTFVKYGLLALRKTRRPGIIALLDKSKIKKENLGVYEIGHIIAPRLNAMGRLSSAMDSLRLICTTNKERAEKLSFVLSKTNFERQQLTVEVVGNAKEKVRKKEIKNLIFIADKSYQQGIIGLVAGRLVEEYYLPSIVISKGEKFSKASARSVKGFNIIEFLRTASDLLVDVGGHPMAAGFTVETSKLELLEKKLFESAAKLIKKEHLEQVLRIDMELPVEFINLKIFKAIQELSPFGMANPEPTFLTKKLIIENMRLVGNDGKHLKLKLKKEIENFIVDAIAFGIGDSHGLKVGDSVDVVYSLDENVWNGDSNLQLIIKDIRLSD